MERGDNVILGNMCENLPHEMVPMTKFSAFSSWTSVTNVLQTGMSNDMTKLLKSQQSLIDVH